MSLLQFENLQVLIQRKPLFKLARIANEYVYDIPYLEKLCEQIRGRADILTIWERLPSKPNPKVKYQENDNICAVPLVDYDFWWNNQIGKKTRNMVRKALKKDVAVKVEPLNDELILAIERIYNETPVRQNKEFTHYGETYEELKKKFKYWDTHYYGHDFLVAYHREEIIGFIHLIYTEESALTDKILSMKSHWDKAPTNLLIAKAVEHCCVKGIKYLVYEKITGGSLGRFKKNNGFIEMVVPRYYIPLSRWGKIICFLRLYRGIYYYYIRTKWLQNALLKFRSGYRMLRGLF